jgi:hypothetical protein
LHHNSINFHGSEADPATLDQALHWADRVYVTDYPGEKLELAYLGWLRPKSASGQCKADFANAACLIQAMVDVAARDISITSLWRSTQPITGDVTIFVHVYDPAGQLVAQGDGDPLHGLWPIRRWRPGDAIEDRREIQLPGTLLPGDYTVALGLYDRTTGQRLTALDPSGRPYQDNAAPISTFRLPLP